LFSVNTKAAKTRVCLKSEIHEIHETEILDAGKYCKEKERVALSGSFQCALKMRTRGPRT